MDFMSRNKDKVCLVKAENLDRQLTQIWADLACIDQKYGQSLKRWDVKEAQEKFPLLILASLLCCCPTVQCMFCQVTTDAGSLNAVMAHPVPMGRTDECRWLNADENSELFLPKKKKKKNY